MHTSINLTIFNKEPLLGEVLTRIKHFTEGPYELVCVLDSCTDRSPAILQEFAGNNPQIPIKILEGHELFETAANNLAAQNSDGEHIIIVQDDMLVNEPGWNSRLVKPLVKFCDIFAVTARTAHNWRISQNAKSALIPPVPGQWSDILLHTDHADRRNTPRDTLAIRECVNRGPLALRHDVFRQLGYFDPMFYPQDMDDHDLCYRAREVLGMFCGCYWIDFISQDDWGGTRENGQPKQWLLDANHKNSKIVLERHRAALEAPKIIESRTL